MAECFGVGSSCSERTHSRRPDSHMLSLVTTEVRYTVFNTKVVQNRFTLARIGNSFRSEVPTGVVTSHEFARNSSHNANNNFLIL